MKTINLRMMALAITCLLAINASAQRVNLNKIKSLNDSIYQINAEYLSGNKYQKDAILFMDMVADTHPYFVKPERREEWFKKKDDLLSLSARIFSLMKILLMHSSRCLADCMISILT